MGRTIFYVSLGSSTWSLVQANDACIFHPIQAVTAKGGVHSFQKKAFDIIGVGDIVFCQVQRSQQYYAHIVLDIINEDFYVEEPKYYIGNIMGRVNGWRRSQHIYLRHPGGSPGAV